MENIFAMLGGITLGQIIGYSAAFVTILSIFIEITPVKINPLSALLKWAGQQINGDLIRKVDFIETSVSKNDAENRRARILQFGDECRRHLKHSQESFGQVLEDIDAYEMYCDTHPLFKNSKTVLTTEYIKNAYNKCIQDNDFL